MSGNHPGPVIQSYFAAYESKNRAALEALLSEDFVFSSPRDDRIDREAYFSRCWTFNERVLRFRIEKLFERENEAFVQYECEPKTGAKFRNTEFFRVEGGKVKEVVVYFGRTTSDAKSES
jgi:ketosteroid isomerase-like protein